MRVGDFLANCVLVQFRCFLFVVVKTILGQNCRHFGFTYNIKLAFRFRLEVPVFEPRMVYQVLLEKNSENPKITEKEFTDAM